MSEWKFEEIQNLLDNLADLSQCLLAGGDYCSVSIIEGAIHFLQYSLDTFFTEGSNA